MYCPSILIGPFGPAPYLIILKPPVVIFLVVEELFHKERGTLMCTENEPHNQTHGYMALDVSLQTRISTSR